MGKMVPLADYIAEIERDPARKAALIAARKRLAIMLYAPGTPDYERMMRGEPPCSPDDATGEPI